MILKNSLHRRLCGFHNSFNLKFFSSKVKLDPYLILEVNRNADWPTIKKSYFRLARLYHPDVNKNDERAQKKFLLVKDAYEYFEKKYNPKKYENIRTSFSFDEDNSNDKTQTKEGEEKFESVREKNKKKENSSTENEQNFSADFNENNSFSSEEIEKIRIMNIEIQKQEQISKFLLSKMPAPRSSFMVDRLGLKEITLGRGKIFGPDEYLGFTMLTFFLIIMFVARKRDYETNEFKNLEYVNIYNALKPSEVLKIYEDHQKSPIEEVIEKDPSFQRYKNKKRITEIVHQSTDSMVQGMIRDIPRVNLKQEYNKNIKQSPQ